MTNPSTSTIQPSTNSLPAHLHGLDGIRAMSIILVLASHICHFNFGPNQWSQAANKYGAFGVEIFFVLSGFLITWLLIREERKIGRIDYRAFYIRRAIRILPPAYFYLLVVGILAMSGILTATLNEFFAGAFFYRNWAPEGSTLTGHYWSLSIEEQFYLLWPVLAFSLPKPFRIPVTLALCLIAPIWRHIAQTSIGVENWMRTDLRYDSLLWGAFMAFLWIHDPLRQFFARKPQRNVAIFFLSWVVIITSFCAEAVIRSGIVALPAPPLRYLCVCLMMAALVNGRSGVLGKVLESPPLAWLGTLSYSLYLWQQVFCYPSHEANPSDKLWIHQFPTNLVLSIAAAALSFYVVEAPFRSLRARFRP
ncbi:MAG: acyltransferase [Verrucomicrobia bacterium]|nr:acyltransferase [Verrucomicrobiota bacterium]